MLRMATYEAAVSRLYSLQSNQAVIDAWKAERLSTKTVDLREETMRHMQMMGVKVDELSVVHVAGTKGKGSVCQFTESVVRAHGVSTGTFVSPHLVEPRERIRLQGRPISRDLFARYFFETEELLLAGGAGPLPPFFRFLNCMAFLVFQREKVELAVVEVGVGGRTCSTNVVTPVISVITRLGYDHMDVLGPTLTNIAFEKGGIMKTGVACLSCEQEQEPLAELQRQAAERGTALLVVPNDALPQSVADELQLKGEYQRQNAALGLVAARYWLAHHRSSSRSVSVSEQRARLAVLSDLSSLSAVERAALVGTSWRGRAQEAEHNGKRLYLDGAHTAESIQLACNCFAVGSHDCSWQRSLAQRYSGKASVQVASNVTAALALAEEHADNVLVTGSLYLVGAALEVLKWPVDDL